MPIFIIILTLYLDVKHDKIRAVVIKMKLEIKNLYVKTIDNKEILKDFSLCVAPGEIHAIMGPNGTGKSTLSKVIMGSPDYLITSGDILADNTSICSLETDKRANLGIFLAYQNPVSIEGVSSSEFLRSALQAKESSKINIYEFMKNMDQAYADLQMDPNLMHRSINENFSGGERKKNEIMQLKLLKPKFIILDELDSGLDIDSLKIVCNNINQYLETFPTTSVLIITHYPRILEYIKPQYVHIMNHGKIIQTGDISLAFEIEKKGYILSTNAMSGVETNE